MPFVDSVPEAPKAAQPKGQLLDSVPSKGTFVDEVPSSSAPASTGYTPMSPGNSHYDGFVRHYADQYRVPVEFVRAIINNETGGLKDPAQAQSRVGARGIMQLMPDTFTGMGFDIHKIHDPETNIHAGIQYLSQQLIKYGGDWEKAAGAYNAGPGAMDHHLRTGAALPNETIAYMQHVREHKAHHDTTEADFRNRSMHAASVAAADTPYKAAVASTGYHPPKAPARHEHEKLAEAGMGAGLAQVGGAALHAFDQGVKGAEKHIWDAIHTPLKMLDAVLGAPQRFVSGATIDQDRYSNKPASGVGDVLHRAGQSIAHGADVATHPFDDQKQESNIQATLHSIGMSPGAKQAGEALDRGVRAAESHLPERVGRKVMGHDFSVPIRGDLTKAVRLMEVMGAQMITDPTMVAGPVHVLSAAATASDVLKATSAGAKAVAGMDHVFGPARRAAQSMGREAVNRGKWVFGRRPELDEYLDHVGKAARLGIESKISSQYTAVQRRADEEFMHAHANDFANIPVDATGSYVPPPWLKQRMLQEPYVHGTAEMRQEAERLGYVPTAEEAAKPPGGIFDYNVRDDYMTMIRPKAKADETDMFRSVSGMYKDAKAGFERVRRGEDTRKFKPDELIGVIDNRLALARFYAARRMVDRETEDFLKTHGGWKATGDVNVSKLSHESAPAVIAVHNKLLDVEQVPPFNVLRAAGKMGSQSVMGNPLPHGLRNVGELAFLAGGPKAFGKGVAYAGKGLEDAQRTRLEQMGLDSGYTRSIQGPLKRLGDYMVDRGGPLAQGGAKAGSAYIHGGQVVLDRLELGFRQALLDHYDEVMGASKSIADEYTKADLVRRDLGDYRNVSIFVKSLQALGGPFVAFRVGTVPAAVGRALVRNPQRVEAHARAANDLDVDPQSMGGPAELVLGGPVDDFAKAAFSGVDYFTSPATMGVVGTGVQKYLRTKQGQGEGGGSLLAEQAREYLPGAGMAESLFEMPYGAVPGVSPLQTALVQVFGDYFKKRPNKKTRATAFKRFDKGK